MQSWRCEYGCSVSRSVPKTSRYTSSVIRFQPTARTSVSTVAQQPTVCNQELISGGGGHCPILIKYPFWAQSKCLVQVLMLTKLCLTQHNINRKSFLCVSLFCMGKHEHVGASMLVFFLYLVSSQRKKGIKMSPIQASCKKKKNRKQTRAESHICLSTRQCSKLICGALISTQEENMDF